MHVINFNNRGGEALQLYRIEHGALTADPPCEAYLLATGYQHALEVFPYLYASQGYDPREFPENVSDDTRASAMLALRRIERVAHVVLAERRHVVSPENKADGGGS